MYGKSREPGGVAIRHNSFYKLDRSSSTRMSPFELSIDSGVPYTS